MVASRARIRAALQKATLSLASFGACFVLIEIGTRLLDPFPYFDPAEINHTEHGNLSQFDPLLGWKGVPSASEVMTTASSRVRLEHDRSGFREPERGASPSGKAAIVFLGDSFAWGYEVAAEAMFVNRLRQHLPDREVFNLAHRGYGTDQSLLTFQQWQQPGELDLVILMFSENDVVENNSNFAYGKYKPMFELDGDDLRLGVPVPRVEGWGGTAPPRLPPDDWVLRTLRRSHFASDLLFRLGALPGATAPAPSAPPQPALTGVTSAILRELKNSVADRGGKLLVVLIPSKLEIEQITSSVPYQRAIEGLCRELGIDTIDLAASFEPSWRRSYFRLGMHWNPRGHAIAARALAELLAHRLSDRG